MKRPSACRECMESVELHNQKKIMKTLVKMGLSQMPIEKKIVNTRFMVTSMTGNANFGTPNPTLATITANVNALEAASIAAKGGGKDETANMRAKEVVLDLSLKVARGLCRRYRQYHPCQC